MEQGDIGLLEDRVAQRLLETATIARLGYTWRDGSPRVVAMWFDWSGGRLTMGTPERAPKLKLLRNGPRIAVTIDEAGSFPWRELMIRGRAKVEVLDDMTPEYERSAIHFFGAERAEAFTTALRGKPMARITVIPDWVGLLDFETRFPSALT